MTHTSVKFALGAIAFAITAIAAQAQAPSRPYQPVTDDRLKSPEAANWLMYRGNYSGWGYSPLKAINDKNVGRLVPAWSYTTGVTEGHQAPPIVNGGYMFVPTRHP